jgi:hemolysin activation/secretion protein
MQIKVLLGMGLIVPVVAAAQNVGSGDNFVNPGAPNYRAPAVPSTDTEQNYVLPPLAPPPTPDSPRFTPGQAQMFVSRIQVEGITVFKPAQISAMTAPYENRMVSAAELQSLRLALTRLYVDAGYIDSGVVLPDQQSREGVVLFRAVEGVLKRVEISGKSHLSHRYVESRVRRGVKNPLNVNALQGTLRQLQQDPNIQRLDASLVPGDLPGEAVLRMNIQEQPRFSAGLSVNNHQSTSIGSTAGSVILGARDLTGFGDDLRASIGRSQGNTIGSAVWSLPLSTVGTSMQAYYSRANARIVQEPFDQLDIKEQLNNWGVSFNQTAHESLKNKVQFFVGGESGRAYTEVLGMPFSFSPGAQDGVTKTTVAYAGGEWIHRGSSSVTDLRLTYRRGLDAMNATIYDPARDPDGIENPLGIDGRFGLEQLQFLHATRVNGLFKGLSKLNDRTQLIFRASGQMSQDSLLSLAKFTVGGASTLRGVPENLFTRDNGVAATLELQLPLPGYRPQPYIGNLVFAPFIDAGRSWDKNNVNRGSSGVLLDTSKAVNVVTAGMGLIWNPLRGLDVQAYWGHVIADNFGAYNPLNNLPNDLQSHGVHYAATYTYRW